MRSPNLLLVVAPRSKCIAEAVSFHASKYKRPTTSCYRAASACAYMQSRTTFR